MKLTEQEQQERTYLERLYNDMSEGKDLTREQKNEFFPRVSNSVCKICGNPALESNNLCFEHLVCNVPKQTNL